MNSLDEKNNTIENSETVLNKKVSCNGGGVLGHPKVFLDMGKDSQITCPYCSKQFILKQ
tara:strand:+ start:254 stop:430 length:177 start_codon:yes stop_codon:yes gene_type:complete